jgi:glycogen debranching enzyme
VRPLLAARDYHCLGGESAGFCFDAQVIGGGNVAWQPYPDRPAITALTSGRYQHDPIWYRQFLYVEERARGLDHLEDLGAPGIFRFRLEPAMDWGRSATVVLRAGRAPWGDAGAIAADHQAVEIARRGDPIERAVDAYLVRRGSGLTVVAGYPWFTDWGRDTFIAIRGLCLAPGRPAHRLDQARAVLTAWADEVTGGMVPNRFTDGEAPELNAVDASLWFVIAAGELLERAQVSAAERQRIAAAVESILSAYLAGTRYRIGCAEDGLIAAGEPGVQLTWMDAKVDGRVITPRIGKPVEIQALWVNALAVGERLGDHAAAARFAELRRRATESFLARFPASSHRGLNDVVDADHVPGNDDASFRPNQIFAVGGLPLALIEGPAARAVVDEVERRLWTPRGLRSLDPDDPAYRSHYQNDQSSHGSALNRDESYHQGTVWPWLAGPFVEAWLRVRGNQPEARAEARRRFVEPMAAGLVTSGLGHISEIADGDPPHAPRGAPFQAWSLGEYLRARAMVNADKGNPR